MSDLSVYFTNSGFYSNYTANETLGNLPADEAKDRAVIEEALGVVDAGKSAPKAAVKTLSKYCSKESEVANKRAGVNSMHAQLMSCVAVKVATGRLPEAKDSYTANVMEGVDAMIDGAKAYAKAASKPEQTQSGLSVKETSIPSFGDAVYTVSFNGAFAFAPDPSDI